MIRHIGVSYAENTQLCVLVQGGSKYRVLMHSDWYNYYISANEGHIS